MGRSPPGVREGRQPRWVRVVWGLWGAWDNVTERAVRGAQRGSEGQKAELGPFPKAHPLPRRKL